MNEAENKAFCEPYIYSPIDHDEIRLIKLKPVKEKSLEIEIHTTKHDAAGDYDALSYVWGKGNPDRVIACNGYYLEVTESLVTALIYIRHLRKSRVIWIDQICINQADLNERSQQVTRMDRIYAQANRVVVWLGKDTNEQARLAKELIEIFAEWSPIDKKVDYKLRESLEAYDLPGADSPTWVAFEALASLPYFTRVWVLQEIQLAKRVEIFWGAIRLNLDDLRIATDRYSIIEWAIAARHPTAGRLGLNQMIDTISERSTLEDWLEATKIRHTTNAKDRIFAIRGLVNDVKLMEADYSLDQEQILITMTRDAIQQTKKLSILRFVINYPRIMDNWPSWVPRWNDDSTNESGHYAGYENGVSDNNYATSGDLVFRGARSLNPRILGVKGLRIGYVTEVSDSFLEQKIDQMDRICESWRLLKESQASVYPGQSRIEALLWILTSGSYSSFDGRSTERFPKHLLKAFLNFIGSLLVSELTTTDAKIEEKKIESLLEIARSIIHAYFEMPEDTINHPMDDFDQWRKDLDKLVDRSHPQDEINKFNKIYRDAIDDFLAWDFSEDHAPNFARCILDLHLVNGQEEELVTYSRDMYNKRTYVTDSGYFGIGPVAMQKGDIVVVLFGGNVPYVLRPTYDGHQFVGGCYTHTIMYGEHVQNLQHNGHDIGLLCEHEDFFLR